MVNELIPLAGNSILLCELEQVIRDVEFLDAKIEEYEELPDNRLYVQSSMRRSTLVSYRDALLGELIRRFPTVTK